jgi:hypothetical protein
MGQTDFAEWLQRRPFRPFRIHVTDGSTYDIRHPDQVVCMLLAVWVVTPGADPSGVPWDLPTTISLQQISRLVPLPSLAPTAN